MTPIIRLLQDSDLEQALGLSSAAGWNQQADDWQMLLRLAAAGSYCASLNGRIVGTAIGIDYVGFGWIAMMLVDEQYRGHGVGGRLLEAALEAIPGDRPVRLDATPMGRPLYRRYGFEDEAELTRHVAEPGSPGAAEVDPELEAAAVRSMTSADLNLVLSIDPQVFGGRREAVLKWSADRAPQYAWIVQDRAGEAHYCFGRHGRLFDQIGPVVTSEVTIGRALVSAALRSACARPVAIDAFTAPDSFSRWLVSRGFEDQRPLYRMIRQPRAAPVPSEPVPYPLRQLAIFGPEFA